MHISDLNLNYGLKDDGTPYGGISFLGETLLDFLETTNIIDEDPLSKYSVKKLDRDLSDCGIAPINIKKAKLSPKAKQKQAEKVKKIIVSRNDKKLVQRVDKYHTVSDQNVAPGIGMVTLTSHYRNKKSN